MSRRVVLALSWVAATLVAVFVALQAVGAVGRQVTDRPAAAARQVGATAQPAALPAATPSTTETAAASASTDASQPPAVPTSSTRPPQSATAPPEEPVDPGPATPGPNSNESSSESDHSTASGPDPAPSPGPTTSYNLQGGSIGVRCSGSSIALVYSSPAPGFSAEVESAGPSEVDVRFESDNHRSRIKVQCSSGSPVVTDQREES
ncbi:MAG: hypothetical protein QOH64_2612 [Acidimicrobiaceae bacterium]